MEKYSNSNNENFNEENEDMPSYLHDDRYPEEDEDFDVNFILNIIFSLIY